MEWKGIKQEATPVDSRPGYALEQYNAELSTEGELRRRPGQAQSGIAQQAGAILGIAAAAPTHGNFVTFVVGGGLNGMGVSHGATGNDVFPPPRWDRPKWKVPVGATCRVIPASASGGSGAGGTGYALALRSCAGTLFVSATESGTSGSNTGANFNVNMTPMGGGGISGCLVNNGTSFTIPAGTTSITITVTVGCAGGARVVVWSTNIV
jgi:hypothetical protein